MDGVITEKSGDGIRTKVIKIGGGGYKLWMSDLHSVVDVL